MVKPGVTPLVRAEVEARSGGVCEACGRDRAEHVHHRKLRRFGDHRAVNLLFVSARCHDRIHGNRDGQSYPLGLLVASWDDPAEVQVHGWAALDPDHCGWCNRPLPHTDAELRACPGASR